MFGLYKRNILQQNKDNNNIKQNTIKQTNYSNNNKQQLYNIIYYTKLLITYTLLLAFLLFVFIHIYIVYYIPYNYSSTNKTLLFTRTLCYNEHNNCIIDNITLSMLPYIYRYIILNNYYLRLYTRYLYYNTINNIHTTQLNSRSIFYDKYITTIIQQYNITQIILLGSGYDTRSYRIGQNIHYYELDINSAIYNKIYAIDNDIKLNYKIINNNTIQYNNNNITYIVCDFNNDNYIDLLLNNNFDKSQNTIITAEGLLYYLYPNTVDKLFKSINQLTNYNTKLYFLYDVLPLCVLTDNTHSCNNTYDTHKMTKLLDYLNNINETVYYGIDIDNIQYIMKQQYNLYVHDIISTSELVLQYPLDNNNNNKRYTVSDIDKLVFPSYFVLTSNQP